MSPDTLVTDLSPSEIADVNDALAENGYEIAIGADGQTFERSAGGSFLDGTIFLPKGCTVANIWKLARSGKLPGTDKNPIPYLTP